MNFLRRHGRLMGRLFMVAGLLLAGAFSNQGWLPQPAGEWRAYSIQSLERNTSPHRGRAERSFRLKTSDDHTVVLVDSDVSQVFKSQALLGHAFPTVIDVLSSGADDKGVIRAAGLRLADGQWLLDPGAVKAIRQPFEILGVAICSLLVLLGIGMQIVGRRKTGLKVRTPDSDLRPPFPNRH